MLLFIKEFFQGFSSTITLVTFVCMCVYMLLQIKIFRESLFAKEKSLKQKAQIILMLGILFLLTNIVGEKRVIFNFFDFQSFCLYAMLFGFPLTASLFFLLVMATWWIKGTLTVWYSMVIFMGILLGSWFKKKYTYPWHQTFKAVCLVTFMSVILMLVAKRTEFLSFVVSANALVFVLERFLGLWFLLFVIKKTANTVDYDAFTEELKMARKIQKNIVPKVKEEGEQIEGYRIGALLLPAKEVGGDWYDFAKRGERIDFVIGDVSGKGMPAALFMSIACVLFRSICDQKIKPIETLSLVNNILFRENKISRLFITLCGGCIDIKSGELNYASIGHTISYVKRTMANELIKLPLTQKGVLGIKENVKYAFEKFALQKGDILFLYTDGVTEAQNQKKELYGVKRLENFLQNTKYQNIQLFLTELMQDILDFAGPSEQTDDITLLVIIKEA